MQPLPSLHYQQTNPGVLLVGAILLIASMVPDVRAQDIPTLTLKHFELVEIVRFDKPDTLLIAGIDQIDRDEAGRWLVTDPVGEQILLFDSDGALLASLDPRNCHPGFIFRPSGARFAGNEVIFILNSGDVWGYRFTTEGACLGSADRDFTTARFFDIDPTGALYGAYIWPERALKIMSSTGKTLGKFPLPPSRFRNASKWFADGGLIADGKHLFYAQSPDLEILQYALNGTLIEKISLKTISKRSSWFRSPRKDLPPDTARLFPGLKDWRATAPSTLFELTDQMLMVQYVNDERGTGYQVFTKDGMLVAEELGLKSLFLHGESGLVYRPIQPRLDGQGELPNPYVEVYRFVAPE